MRRRDFIEKTGILTIGGLVAPSLMQDALAYSEKKITLLHTNDTHSRLDPFPNLYPKIGGLGGINARAALIDKIRATHKNVLLFDCGDIFQGTPYFNYYLGEPEIKAMSLMGYDAATMGNHDFDAGINNFAIQLKHSKFPILVANYVFENTPLENKIQPYQIFKKDGIKIGVFGIGIALEGLVAETLFGNTKYLDPIARAQAIANTLKNDKNCDLIVCLSHLGYKYESNKASDIVLANSTTNIDIILGGHTHTFMEKPDIQKNKLGLPVLINQVGWGGAWLGQIDVVLLSGKKDLKHATITHNVTL